VPTCGIDEPVGDVAKRLFGTSTRCVVVNDRRIVAGLLVGLDTMGANDQRPASEVMRPGPGTIRPSEDLGEVRQRMSNEHLSELLVTTPDGELLGILRAG
jgi:CBS domain-containing protein